MQRDDDGSTRPDATDLVIVSNREPYSHRYTEAGVAVDRPAGGLVIALDAVAAATDATWIAWGSGDADFDTAVVASDDTLGVPPDEPRYRLARVALSDRQVDGYYYGYSNQVLWPLCHLDTNYVHYEPWFWDRYRECNRVFAEAVRERDPGTVWIHDYHLALVPRFLEATDVEAQIVYFWHIPWPPAAVFEICPHADAVLEGLLATDHFGFQTEIHRQQFLETVPAHLPTARVDHDTGTVAVDGDETATYVSPVGIDVDAVRTTAASDPATRGWRTVRRRFDLDDETLLLGVDRLDYTKGLLLRLDAIERLLETRPDLHGSIVYLQKATTTRESIAAYRRYHQQVVDRIHEINRAYRTDDWQPIRYLDDELSRPALLGLYRRADVCIVSSKRDGMNLVAKEYVAAAGDTDGVLVLSEFTGAAEALCPAALAINPFDTGGFTGTLEAAIRMDTAERRERLERLRSAVDATSIEAWLADQPLAIDAGR